MKETKRALHSLPIPAIQSNNIEVLEKLHTAQAAERKEIEGRKDTDREKAGVLVRPTDTKKTPSKKTAGMYFYSVPEEVKEIFERYCFWKQKTKTETLTIVAREFYKRLKEKEELPAIPENRDILKHVEKLREQQKDVVKVIQDQPVIK